jgi:hypothetical protein
MLNIVPVSGEIEVHPCLTIKACSCSINPRGLPGRVLQGTKFLKLPASSSGWSQRQGSGLSSAKTTHYLPRPTAGYVLAGGFGIFAGIPVYRCSAGGSCRRIQTEPTLNRSPGLRMYSIGRESSSTGTEQSTPEPRKHSPGIHGCPEFHTGALEGRLPHSVFKQALPAWITD